MKWKTTWLLVLLAAVMFVYIVTIERHRVTAPGGGPINAKVVPGSINDITALQVRRTNQLVVRAERNNGLWHLTAPIAYPAQNISIVALLAELNNLTGPPHITRELQGQRGQQMKHSHTLKRFPDQDLNLTTPTAESKCATEASGQ